MVRFSMDCLLFFGPFVFDLCQGTLAERGHPLAGSRSFHGARRDQLPARSRGQQIKRLGNSLFDEKHVNPTRRISISVSKMKSAILGASPIDGSSNISSLGKKPDPFRSQASAHRLTACPRVDFAARREPEARSKCDRDCASSLADLLPCRHPFQVIHHRQRWKTCRPPE